MNTNNRTAIILVLILFALYLILKWTCRLIFGLLDYAILIGLLTAVISFLMLPKHRKQQLIANINARIKAIGNKLGMD